MNIANDNRKYFCVEAVKTRPFDPVILLLFDHLTACDADYVSSEA